MYAERVIAVIIPVLNEEESVGQVLEAIPGYVDKIIVVDNGSTDNSVDISKEKGAQTVIEPELGYGAACLKGLSLLDNSVDIVVFLDGDFSDHPEEMNLLLDPIVKDKMDIVIGSRMINPESSKHLTPVARFGNRLSTFLINLIWDMKFSDLGPFRAVTAKALDRLKMSDRDFGWTVELQIKAARMKLKAVEVPVSYRPRIGVSKISGTISGSIKAGTKILYIIFRELLRG